jgi:hypothetical protein
VKTHWTEEDDAHVIRLIEETLTIRGFDLAKPTSKGFGLPLKSPNFWKGLLFSGVAGTLLYLLSHHAGG